MATQTDEKFTGTPRKVTAHLTQNEGLSFEKSAPGKKAYRLAPLDVPEVDPASLLGEAARIRERGTPRTLARSKSSATSRASPPGTTPSTSACIRWAAAP